MKMKEVRERRIKEEIGKITELIGREALRAPGEVLRIQIVLRDGVYPGNVYVSLDNRRQAVSIDECFELTTEDWQEVLRLPWGPKTQGVVQKLYEKRDHPPGTGEVFFGKRLGYWFGNLNGVFCKHNAPFRIKAIAPYRRGFGKPAQIVRTNDESSAE